MIEKGPLFLDFKYKLDGIYEEFKKLSLGEQIVAVEIVTKCVEEMQKSIELSKLSASNDGSDKITGADNNNDINKRYCDGDKSSPIKCPSLVNQLNVLSGSDLYLQDSVQEIYSDSEKEETNDFADSSRTELKEQLNSLVERLENDEELIEDVEKLSKDVQINVKEEKVDSEPLSNANYSCFLCNQQMKTYSSLLDHIYKHSGTQLSCLACKFTFENFIPYEYHLMNNMCTDGDSNKKEMLPISKITCCPVCGKWFKKTFNYKRHIVKLCNYTETDVPNTIKQIKCTLCLRQFSEEEHYKKHIEKHDDNKCKVCAKVLESRKLLRRHQATHIVKKTLYRCDVCAINFKNRNLYREHMKQFKNDKNHIDMRKSSNTVTCKTCSMNFVDEKSYKKHCKSKSHMKASNEAVPEFKEFICENCGAAFDDKNALRGHIRKLHKRELIKCDQCSYATRTTYNLTRHKNVSHHKVHKKYACDKCPSLFDALSVLKEHIICVHTDERPFSCDLCDKKFKLKNRLKKHQLIHTSILPYSCEHCSKKFRRNNHLKRHLLTNHDELISKPSDLLRKPQVRSHKLPAVPNTEMAAVDDDRVFSCMDVQSGELVQLSNIEMLKNNVINITTEGELLSYVHIPEFWPNQEPELYSVPPNPILQDGAEVHPTYMLAQNPISVPQPTMMDVPKDVISGYVPNFMHLTDHKSVENMDIMERDPLPQNIETTIMVNHQPYDNLLPMCIPSYYNNAST